ncbi:MAG TPA: ABC transporter permease [Chloroflexota bacterium]|nr:ABC transporter permease [Chloroflexota bacterium]
MSVADAVPGGLDREVPIRQIGQWALVWRRFTLHRFALLSLLILLLIVAVAVVGPLFTPPLPYNLPSRVFNIAPSLHPRTWTYLLGTDGAGNPILSYVILGARATLEIGFLGALLAAAIGTAIGGLAGYLGGIVDALLMRLVDLLLAVPTLPLLILLGLVLNSLTLSTFILLLGLTGWAGVARLMRSSTLSLRQREYAEAARALGVSSPGIIVRHILPNALDVLIVSTTLNVAVFIILEATLEFLAITPQEPTWGRDLALTYYTFGISLGYWWEFVFTGGALLVTVLTVNFLGDGLRDALDAAAGSALIKAARQLEADARRERLRRAIGRSLRPLTMAIATGWGVTRSGASGAVGAGRRGTATAAGLVLPRPAVTWLAGEESRTGTSAPPWLRFGPPALVILALGIVYLLGHSQLAYAPNYSAPTHLAVASGDAPFGAVPRKNGWDLLEVNAQNRLVYQRVESGTIARQVTLAGGQASEPSLAEGNGKILAAWVTGSNQQIEARVIGSTRGWALVPPGGVAEHPQALILPGGRPAVVFDWERANGQAFDLYLATLSASTIRLARLAAGPGDLAIAATASRIGAIVVMWLRNTNPDTGDWQVRLGRFTPGGRPLGQSANLGAVSYVAYYPNSASTEPGSTPPGWAGVVQPQPDGSLWAAWVVGNFKLELGATTGAGAIWVEHLSPSGRMNFPPTIVDPTIGAIFNLGFAVDRAGMDAYYINPPDSPMFVVQNHQLTPIYSDLGGNEASLVDERFNRQGVLESFQRVSYDPGGDADYPVAGTVAGKPRVVWEHVTANNAILEAATRGPYRPPDLPTRLGLNIGPAWVNILLLLAGALAGGALVAAFNAVLIAILVALWFPVSWIAPRRLRWPVYLVVIAAVLWWVFIDQAVLPSWIIFISGLGAPTGWFGERLAAILAVAGGVFVAGWAGRYLWPRQETIFRAVLMAFASVYVVGILAALIYIQGQIQQV